MKDLLRTNLTELADRAQPVDLLPQVHATSRKLRRHRAAAIAVAATAVVVVAAVGGTVVGLASGPHHHAPATRVTGTPTPGTSTPTSPAPAGSSAAGADPPAPATTIPGTVYYNQDASGDGSAGTLANATVYTLTGGTLHAMRWTLGLDDRDYMVSPDGRTLARSVGDNADLAVERAGDQVTRTIVPDAGAVTPIWSPDSSRILYIKVAAAGSTVWMVNADGSHNHRVSGDNANAPVWSGGGSRIAYWSDNYLVTVNADGTGRHAVLSGKAGMRVYRVTSLSSDGTKAVVDLQSAQGDGTPGERSTYLSNGVLMDTRTGKVLPWPVQGRIVGARFTPGDGLLLRLSDSTTNALGPYRLMLVSAGGTVLAKQAEPAPPKGQLYQLMGYRPAVGN